MIKRETDGLWTSTVFDGYPWDHVFTTAWIIHRLLPTSTLKITGWKETLDRAIFEMIQQALNNETWSHSTEVQRFRVEARIAAAVARAREISGWSFRSADAATIYLGSWKQRARDFFPRISDEELDVATAAFGVEARFPLINLLG